MLKTKSAVFVAMLIACTTNENNDKIRQVKAEEPIFDASQDADSSLEKCSIGMVYVNGTYCRNVTRRCSRWLDPPMKDEEYRRCSLYAPEVKCSGGTEDMSFCMDRDEYKDPGSELPMGDVSWSYARTVCENHGKRLCSDKEWTLACEGPEMLPYPYGIERSTEICYNDKLLPELVNEKGEMNDLRLPVSTHPGCISPYGVHNTVGNIDEWVWITNGQPPLRSGLKGGWWGAGLRSKCRPMTFGHDEFFHEIQTGFRCCSDLGPTGR